MSYLEHQDAALLSPAWIGKQVDIGVARGVLSDFELRDGTVVLYMDGLKVRVRHDHTVTRGELDVPGK